MRRALARADVVVLGFRPADPARYGRLIVDGKQLVAIREFNDATPAERAIDLCNAGVMAFTAAAARLLGKIGNANAKGEYYLTDLVELANASGKTVVALMAAAQAIEAGVEPRDQRVAGAAVAVGADGHAGQQRFVNLVLQARVGEGDRE